jgi:hypothetical protein
MWLTQLKTALVLEDIQRIGTLIEEMPRFETLEQMEEASYLLLQTKVLLEKEKTATLQSMQQLKNNINFLKSTQTDPTSSLNLKF